MLHPRRGGDVLRAFFSTPDLELPDAPETPLLVTGETTDGRRWRGQDSIELVPDPGRGNGEDGEDERAEAADDDGPDDGEGHTPGRGPDGDGKRGPGRGPGNGRKRGRGPGRGDTEDNEGGGDDD